MPPSKALRLALARAAEELWSLAAQAQGIRFEVLELDVFLGGLDPGLLYMLLDGPEGHVGAAVLDMQAVSALIEMQTMGYVVEGPAPARPPTHTDAAIAAPLIDRMLAGFAHNLSTDPEGWWAAGYRFGDRIEDRRTLGLMMKGAHYRCFRFEVDFGEGAKTGEVILAFPEREKPAPAPQEEPEDSGRYEAQLARVPAELDAVLDRLSLPLAQVARLRAGDLLPLDRGALRGARLQAGDRVLPLRCELGQSEGMRALRLLPAESAAAGGKAKAGFAAHGMDPGSVTDPEVPGWGDPAEPGGLEGLGDLGDGFGGDLGGDMGGDATGMPGELSPDGAIPEAAMGLGAEGLGEGELPDLPPLDFDAAEGEGGLPELPGGEDAEGGSEGGWELPELDDLPTLDLSDVAEG